MFFKYLTSIGKINITTIHENDLGSALFNSQWNILWWLFVVRAIVAHSPIILSITIPTNDTQHNETVHNDAQ
jgi:hypothetical protein